MNGERQSKKIEYISRSSQLKEQDVEIITVDGVNLKIDEDQNTAYLLFYSYVPGLKVLNRQDNLEDVVVRRRIEVKLTMPKLFDALNEISLKLLAIHLEKQQCKGLIRKDPPQQMFA